MIRLKEVAYREVVNPVYLETSYFGTKIITYVTEWETCSVKDGIPSEDWVVLTDADIIRALEAFKAHTGGYYSGSY